MKNLSSWRHAAVLIVFAGFTAGCLPYGAGVIVSSDRGVRAPAPTASSAHLYHRADRDAVAYTRHVSRAVRLSPHQQRVVRDILAHRTTRLLDAYHPRDHRYVYPFPRRAAERDQVVRRFWRDTDRAIERQLNPMQRRAYRDYVRYYYGRR